jgi:hypothetical protein
VLSSFPQAGQERFRTLSTSFYRGAHGVILVYDVSSRSSFQSMDKWFEEAETNTVSGAALYLVCLPAYPPTHPPTIEHSFSAQCRIPPRILEPRQTDIFSKGRRQSR